MRFPKSRSWGLLLGWLLWLFPLATTAQSTENLDSLYCRLQTRLEIGATLSIAKINDPAIDTLQIWLDQFPSQPTLAFQRLFAEYHFYIGNAAFYKTYTNPTSTDIQTVDAALHIADSLVSSIDGPGSELKARILRMRGMHAYFMQENAVSAQEFYEAAYQEWLAAPQDDSLELAVLIQCMGQAATKIGEYEKAIDLYRHSLEIREAVFGEMHWRVGNGYWNLGNAYCYSDRYAEATKAYQRALEIYQKTAPNEESTIANIMENLGTTYGQLGQKDEAIANHLAAINLKRKSVPQFSLELADYLHGLALAFAEKGEFKKADAAVAELAMIGKKNGLTDGEFVAHLKFCEAKVQHLKGSDTLAVFTAFQAAMAAISNGSSSIHWKDYPNIASTSEPLLLKQIIEEKSFLLWEIGKSQTAGYEYLKSSLEGFECAAQLGNRLRQEYEDQGDKQFVGNQGYSDLQAALDCAARLFEFTHEPQYVDRALQLMENCKFQLLLDFLRKSRIQVANQLSRPTAIRFDSLRRRCMELDYILAIPELPADSQRYYKSQLISMRLELGTLQDSLEENSQLFKTIYGKQGTIGLDSLRQLLPDRSVAISYAIDDTSVFVLMVGKGVTTFRKTKLPPKFATDVSTWVGLCRRPVEKKEEVQTFIKLGYLIYSNLLEPELHQLQNIDGLLLIPDGILGGLPFEALVTEAPRPQFKGFVRLPYLLRKFRCHYAASATLWSDQRSMQFKNDGMECLGMAWGAEVIKNYGDGNHDIPGLKGTVDELRSLKEILKGKYLVSEKASEANFKLLAPKYGILHLATHARALEADPQILFPSGGNEKEDGILHFHELFPLHLDARLAVLSACETGAGQLIKGDGIQSMSSGFAAAGVPSLLMSLWEVDDNAGSQIIQSFYNGIQSGLSLDQSLQHAKLKYLDQAMGYNAAPFYWSAFVPLGNMDPIHLKTPPTDRWWMAWAGAIILLCIFFSYRIYIKNRKSI